jgi:DNA-directed RNA polymerase subunit H (RpoH/RPB5)
MAENARIRGDDLRYTQQQETHEHVQWLDAQLAMVDKVRTVFMEERRKFVLPVEQISKEQMPRVVKQGPVNG